MFSFALQCSMIDMNTFKFWNPNPVANRTDDCSVRAIAAALDISWDDAYDMISERAKSMGEMMHKNAAWGSVLRQHGFKRAIIPNTCPDCFTARDFCFDHPTGVYVLGFDGHVATVIDGQIWDTWDSSDEIPVYYWFEREG